MTTPKDVLDFIKKNDIEFVDFKFIDLLGTWQHLQVPIGVVNEAMLEEGVMFDGSSIRCWQTIDASDMKMIPDLSTMKVDPFIEANSLTLICDIVDPVTGERYSRDPRNIARKAEAYLVSTGIAEMPNLGYKIGPKLGYFPVAPFDSNQDIRNEMITMLEQCGLMVERAHHEVAPAQHEINFRFDTLVSCADHLQWYKYVIRNVARQHGKTATFMPKPMFADNGSGMHTHQSLWKDGKPLFAGDEYAGLSETALYYIGGILKHAPSLAALTNPLTNSYKRLVKGFEAPINLAYSNRNRSATIRIPLADSKAAKRIEFRCPDPGANGYMAFAAMLMAGLDGIQNKIHPGDPMDVNIYDLPPEELHKIGKMPGSLRESIENLEANHDFLLKGDVFTKDVIDAWVDYKLNEEVTPIESRPHPYEFNLYYAY